MSLRGATCPELVEGSDDAIHNHDIIKTGLLRYARNDEFRLTMTAKHSKYIPSEFILYSVLAHAFAQL